jgi:hypothetical protein
MRLSELRTLLDAHPTAAMKIVLPDGATVPAHYHVTEVGRVRKDFIDCGGTLRSTERCVLQVWVDDGDTAHRLDAGKLARIIGMAGRVLGESDFPVEVEYDVGHVTQFTLSTATVAPSGLLLYLEGKHTACLAPQLCGTERNDAATGCCGQTAAAPVAGVVGKCC